MASEEFIKELDTAADVFLEERAEDNPVDPVDPVDPVIPVELVEPVEPVEPIEPVDLVVDPVDPVDPVTPVTDPVEPVVSVVPVVTPFVAPANAISDGVLEQAIRAGLTFSEAKSFPDEASLVRIISSIDAAKGPTKNEEPPVDPFAAIPKLDPEKFEPEVLEMYNSLTDVVKKQHEELQALKATTVDAGAKAEQIQQAEAEEKVTKWFDSKVTELGEDFAEALGTGGYNSLNPASEQFQKREKIASYVAFMATDANQRGQQVSYDELFAEAANSILSGEVKKVADKKLAASLKKRGGQHINRASGGATKKVAGGDPLADTAAEINARFFK